MLAVSEIKKLMKWDDEKASIWMTTKNPNFGNVSPMGLILRGRGNKVIQFIGYAKDENFP